jgi:hypothetical protein
MIKIKFLSMLGKKSSIGIFDCLEGQFRMLDKFPLLWDAWVTLIGRFQVVKTGKGHA